ncbi:3-oxoacyl-ACP reductase FabG [Candidatus Methylospira mobilis]|uniref:3-oxoacyl-ACP reductase FabG n=1 Tax=Candidatus Methylospira mobilis TaxID=1808979 RepID=A0A5Q0BK60_9GAMM|nr:3-oxoacyl-ACP reductase FabG [Candidatus Methylospira mobilis]QFY44200.1 3-oxoacyl-ACP reductase FabG [Candidatus Methylospira mobilis]WNV06374.1 3-oxoacyl-ACP reductase FabG [Candidatus Methylospira mobilis]
MKKALVTGGSGAIGSAIAAHLAAEGLHVFVQAHRGIDKAQETVARIRETGGSAEILVFDVTDAEAARELLEKSCESQPVQLLVNCAGIHDDAVFPGMRPEQWHRVINVSLHGFFNVSQPLIMPMIRSRWGRIVNISSVAAIMGNRGQVNYAAAKAALHGATKSLALEVASRGITVNAVAPGIIESDMITGSFDAESINRLVPMKRAGKPQEVADLVGFLCSERAAYITGQILSINGGMA